MVTTRLGWGFDLGFADSMALTINGAYDVQDRAIEKDGQCGKFGAELRFFRAPERLDKRVPWIGSLAGEGVWLTHTKPQYRVQAGIAVALFHGVDLPLTVSWANQSEFDDEDQVIANVGFTLDIAKPPQASANPAGVSTRCSSLDSPYAAPVAENPHPSAERHSPNTSTGRSVNRKSTRCSQTSPRLQSSSSTQ
jgi:hypothetical protein